MNGLHPGRAAWLGLALLVLTAPAQAQVAIVTHHYDNNRTGWNPNETVLTEKQVANNFGLLGTVTLDDQVDAQPLVVPNVSVTGDPNAGTHDVVYVATENNSVYAIDPTRRTILAQVNLGTPPAPPATCSGVPHYGVLGSPVIDVARNSLYVMSYVTTANGPQYLLHRLSLTDLSDVAPPVTVAAGNVSNNGTAIVFNAGYQKETAALVETGGVVYAAFTSFCDSFAARGWLLGWSADTLAPQWADTKSGVPAGFTTDRLVASSVHPNWTKFLATIWMSGSGPAADADGNLFFVTGNSNATSYGPGTDIQESVVKYSPAQAEILTYFTPDTQQSLDNQDLDFGSGGVMLIPTADSGMPLAVAAGKDGNMYLMKADKLGGHSKNINNVPDVVNIGKCYCAESFFNDGVPRIVSSGGNAATVWTLHLSPRPALEQFVSTTVSTGTRKHGGGFMTAVSSNGGTHAIIWLVTNPNWGAVPATVALTALKAIVPAGSTTMPVLFSGTAGTWPETNANANLVPVVANGYVYVASYKALAVFGLTGE